MIPDLVPVTMVGVFGPVASGKTWLLKRWIERMDRVLIYDTAAEYEDVAEVIEGNPRALLERLDPERAEHDFGQEDLHGQAAPKGGSYRVAYIGRDTQNGFGWAVEATWQLDDPRWLVIEEVSQFMSPWSKHPAMDSLMRFSRKRQLGVIGASQRIADVHKDFCANCRMSVLFHTPEARDLDSISERYGAEAADQVRTLRPLVYSDQSGTVSVTPQALVWVRGQAFQVIEVG